MVFRNVGTARDSVQLATYDEFVFGDRPHHIATIIPNMRKMQNRPEKGPEGTQTMRRASALLRLLAGRRGLKLRLSELAVQSDLSSSTAHRILQGLVAEGWAVQDRRTAQYSLGPLAYEIGLAARPPTHLHKVAGTALERLADESGDTAFLSVRSDLDAVCIDRREGTFPIRALILDIGSRRPLGVGAGALALLMSMADDEVDAVLAQMTSRLAAYRTTASVVRREVSRSRTLGFAFNDGQILAGHKGVALPLRDPYGQVAGALSIAAISDRVSPARRAELVHLMRREVQRVESELAGLARGPIETPP